LHYLLGSSREYFLGEVNSTLLIDAIVRQTTVLIAALATASGQRTPLAHIAEQVFADLVRELKEHGLGNKVIADMFGMALRTYQFRVSRMSASNTQQGRSLWEAVLSHIQMEGPLTRAEVLEHFVRDDESVVRGVLRDLVASGLVYQTGHADATSYRATQGDEAHLHRRDSKALDQLVLVAVHRNAPIDRASLAKLVPSDDEASLDASIERLVTQGTVRTERSGETVRYCCDQCIIPFGASVGWEAAVFDHYQALVTALVTKLRFGQRHADLSDKIGGSTFVFDLWRGHPLADEVLSYLQLMREHGMKLRKTLETHNNQHPKPADSVALRVIAYVGQTVRQDDEDHE
jgi:predicted MarR family transcription regulator